MCYVSKSLYRTNLYPILMCSVQLLEILLTSQYLYRLGTDTQTIRGHSLPILRYCDDRDKSVCLNDSPYILLFLLSADLVPVSTSGPDTALSWVNNEYVTIIPRPCPRPCPVIPSLYRSPSHVLAYIPCPSDLCL